jgi:hypothetical protein
MAKNDFASQVGAFVAKSTPRMTAVFRQSAQDLIEEAQRPRGSGGNMPVDTGFLRNSGVAALNNTPSGESIKPDSYAGGTWDSDAAALIISRAQLGDRIIFGWTARYSVYMEARYRFLRLAAQNWNSIVQRNAKRLEERVKR